MSYNKICLLLIISCAFACCKKRTNDTRKDALSLAEANVVHRGRRWRIRCVQTLVGCNHQRAAAKLQLGNGWSRLGMAFHRLFFWHNICTRTNTRTGCKIRHVGIPTSGCALAVAQRRQAVILTLGLQNIIIFARKNHAWPCYLKLLCSPPIYSCFVLLFGITRSGKNKAAKPPSVGMFPATTGIYLLSLFTRMPSSNLLRIA